MWTFDGDVFLLKRFLIVVYEMRILIATSGSTC
jgi:hypothetical protein